MTEITKFSGSNSQRGVALVMVIFIVALATILVVSVTEATQVSARRNAVVERSLQAEYLLKSAMNVARTMLQKDDTAEDSPQDLWARFSSGMTLPADLLDLPAQNIAVSLEIRPEDAKLPINRLVPVASGAPDQRWRGVILRLFRLLGFDNDLDELDAWGPSAGEHADAEKLVGRLVDYMDADDESYQPGGIESGLDADEKFPNQQLKRVEELLSIPGFTPNRVRKLLPFITAKPLARININMAPSLLIQSLHEDITPEIAQSLIEYRAGEEGPFKYQDLRQTISARVGEDVYDDPQTGIQVLIAPGSEGFQVIAKVDYGSSVYFLRAYLRQQGAEEPVEVNGFELF